MIEEVKTENPTAEAKKTRKNKPKATAAQIALRREKISELMLAGIDDGGVRRIAEFLIKTGIQCSKSTVANDINFLLEESAKNSKENLEKKRAFNDRRLESLIDAHWLAAKQGHLKSGRFVRDLIDDQNELYGLKAAKKLEVTGEDGGPINVRQSIDLSNLSKEELLLMETILAKTETEKDAA